MRDINFLYSIFTALIFEIKYGCRRLVVPAQPLSRCRFPFLSVSVTSWCIFILLLCPRNAFLSVCFLKSTPRLQPAPRPAPSSRLKPGSADGFCGSHMTWPEPEIKLSKHIWDSCGWTLCRTLLLAFLFILFPRQSITHTVWLISPLIAICLFSAER